jgi:diguanylate cyclase (GGDEF)-like protein
MQKSDLSYKINFIGEFSDTKQEREYLQYHMIKTIKYVKLFALFFGILNTLFIIPEYYLMYDMDTSPWTAGAKLVFLAFVVAFLIRIRYMKNYRRLTYWITSLEIFGSMLFLILLKQYETVNFLLQAMGVIIIIIAIFMIQNRWTHMLMVSFLIVGGFIARSIYFIHVIPKLELMSGTLYLLLVLLLCSVTSYTMNYFRRMNFVNSINLMKLSTTDYLTQIYNRGKLEDELSSAIVFSNKCQRQLTLILFDLDNFKMINDSLGHLDGDRLIVQITSLVRESIREEDIFARWGGDEFVLLLPDKDKASGAALAERLRDTIEMNNFNVEVDVKCSFGVVELTPGDDSNSLMKRADQMLYMAKNSGGNRVQA